MRTVLLCLAGLFLPLSPLHAQVAVQPWRPSTEAGGFVAVEPPSAPVGYGVGAALWTQYVREPLLIDQDSAQAVVVSDQLTLDLTASVGLYSWLALSLGIPTTVYQGRGLGRAGGAYVGVGDVRLLPKLVLLRPGDGGRGLGLVLIPEVGLPFGDPFSLLGEGNFTFTPRVALGYQVGPCLLVINAAYRFREGTPFAGLLIDDELLFGLGVEAQVPHLPLAATLELTSATAARRPFLSQQESSVEALLSMRGRVGPVVVQPGLALGLTPGYLVPDYRIFFALAFAPRYQDADGDGVPDRRDRCVDRREDRDGFEDGDGCPETDNDQDGIPDRVDRCPDRAGDDELAGCPAEDRARAQEDT